MALKTIPSKYSTSASVAVGLATMGIGQLQSIPRVQKNAETGEVYLPIPPSELNTKVCAGNLLFAQGLEVLIKLILIVEEIPDAGFKQHEFSKRFDKVKSLDPLKKNIEKYMPGCGGQECKAADEVVAKAEKAFMPARYLGFGGRKEIESVNQNHATGLLVAITNSYDGLEALGTHSSNNI